MSNHAFFALWHYECSELFQIPRTEMSKLLFMCMVAIVLMVALF